KRNGLPVWQSKINGLTRHHYVGIGDHKQVGSNRRISPDPAVSGDRAWRRIAKDYIVPYKHGQISPSGPKSYHVEPPDPGSQVVAGHQRGPVIKLQPSGIRIYSQPITP